MLKFVVESTGVCGRECVGGVCGREFVGDCPTNFPTNYRNTALRLRNRFGPTIAAMRACSIVSSKKVGVLGAGECVGVEEGVFGVAE